MVQEWGAVGGILSACEKLQENKVFCDLCSFKTELCMKCVFVLLPGGADRGEFTSDHSLSAVVIQLTEVYFICLCGKQGFAMCGLTLLLYTA